MRECQNCDFEGIYSHFSCSDIDKEYTQLQIDRFQKVVDKFKSEGFDIPITHLANSAGLLNYPDARFDMVRAGIILYGLHEGFNIPEKVDLKPVMSWYSQVVYFKYLEENEPIGYGKTHVTKEATRIVTAPVGYADGYQRKLSNVGSVLINGNFVPVVGLVCMDHIMIDIGPDGEAYKGDKVTLVGKDGEKEITFYDLSKWARSSVHELIAQISYRVPRFYKD
jgi:alanine racemase